MGSRRMTSRSFSGNGRSINGDGPNGSSRPGGCSYLSNVRPENRSTLCSVIAHLAEETQPSIETTLKSRAVSENSNVKFTCVVTGHPTPQVVWYKDDMQLDRFCGLPKYEISHNGKSHSLHIYNCTVEDAAIYQASASNVKGIVSCSGVLEVGEMNEFRIHQRYFAKIKQKAEHRHRAAAEKENLEPLRTISPERTQRKRRSTMEAFPSTPSSTEDEGNEESNQDMAAETETRLHEATVDDAEEKLLLVTDGVVPAGTSVVNETANQAGTHIQDSAQKVFTAHQPKTPSVKKKIKISDVAKADTPGEKVSEERRTKDENLAAASLACKEAAKSSRSSEEVMEVENTASSSGVYQDGRRITKQLKSAADEAMVRKKPSKDDHAAALPKKEATASPAASTSPTVSGTDVKQAAKHEKKVQRKITQENIEIEIQSPSQTSTQPKTSTLATRLQADEVMDVDVKSDSCSGGSVLHRGFKSAERPHQNRTALPQRPCEQADDQLSGKEAGQKNVCVSPTPTRQSETAQAHTHMMRNDAPVGLELPPDWRPLDEKPPARKPPLKRETTIDDTQIFSWNTGPQALIDNLTQGTCNHSRGSSESNAVLFTDLHKPPLESPDGGEKTRGCIVSPTPLQSQADTAVESDNGTEIQVDKKVEPKEGKRLVRDDSVAANEKIADMETESVALQNVEPSNDKTIEMSESTPNTAEVSSPEIQNVKRVKSEPSLPHLGKTFEHPKKDINIDFKEIPKPVSKVISVAELLRAQLKALDSTLINSVPTVTIQADFLHKPSTTMTETRQQLKEDERKSTETMTDDTNIKATLMEIYHELNRDSRTEHILTQDTASPHVQDLQKTLPTHPVSGEASELCGSAKNYIVKEPEASTQVPQTDYSVVSHNELEKVEPKVKPLASTEDNNLRSETPTKTSSPTPNIDNKPIQLQEIEHVQRLPPELKLNSKNESEVSETNSTTPLDRCTMENVNRSSTQTFPTKSAKEKYGLPKQDSDDDISLHQTPKASPLLKNRNCVSPIPAATVQELASGARPKILIPKTKAQESTEATSLIENPAQNGKLSISPASCSTSPSLSRRSPLLQPPDELTSPVQRRSPLIGRRKTLLETQAPNQQPVAEVQTLKTKDKPAESKKYDPFKAPQVIRKIRSETFADASGHLKLWCQFFNVLSDSTITWYKNEEEIAQLKKNAGDETQVNLAIVQTSRKDSGVYRCSITNDYGTDSTDLLLSADILTGMSLCEDLGVGEEIEMTPLIFSKAVADSGIWGNRLFGRIMMQESQIGDGCSHKVWRAKVIYGLEPVFESGHTCIVKVPNPITYGGKQESCLIDRNLEIVKQGCKIQNLAREYCKIFSAEARLLENFGPCLEVIPVYLMYRPANPVPYATVETDMTGVYQKYSFLDHTGRIDTRTSSWVEQKCCALQHWIHQWTNGNLLFTRLEGVDTKITNVGVSVKSSGHLGLSVEGNPKVFEQFVSQHQCNYFCGLLGLRSLKVMDSLSTPSRPKATKSPLLQRKMAAGSSSPQTGRKAGASPRLSRKAEQEGRKTPTKPKAVDAPKNL